MILINNKFWVYFIQYDNNNTDSKSIRLWRKILHELQKTMKHMTPSLLDKDCTYEQWKYTANKGPYQFFVSWLDDKGEQYLFDICNVDSTVCTSDRLLDKLDESLFALQMARKVVDVEVFAADIFDIIVNLANAIKMKDN